MSYPATAIILAHCTYTAHGIRAVSTHEAPRLVPVTTHLATVTVVQRGQALAGMIFRCDLPPTDPHLPKLIARAVEAIPVLSALLDEDPSRALVVDPVDHRSELPRFPDPAVCREIFLHAFLRPRRRRSRLAIAPGWRSHSKAVVIAGQATFTFAGLMSGVRAWPVFGQLVAGNGSRRPGLRQDAP